MKASIRLSAMCALFALLLVSCSDKDKQQWTGVYGYSIEDIAGQYSYSNEIKAFSNIEPSQYVHICEDAVVSINPVSATTVSFNINCPEDGFSKTFVGRPTKNTNDNMIRMSTGYTSAKDGKVRAYNVLATVYRNDAMQTRLHGHASLTIYKLVENHYGNESRIDTVPDISNNYYFDVIKN